MHEKSFQLPPEPLTRFIRKKEILSATGFSNCTLWRLLKSGEFPKSVKIGPNTVVWRLADYEKWAENPEAWAKKNQQMRVAK